MIARISRRNKFHLAEQLLSVMYLPPSFRRREVIYCINQSKR